MAFFAPGRRPVLLPAAGADLHLSGKPANKAVRMNEVRRLRRWGEVGGIHELAVALEGAADVIHRPRCGLFHADIMPQARLGVDAHVDKLRPAAPRNNVDRHPNYIMTAYMTSGPDGPPAERRMSPPDVAPARSAGDACRISKSIAEAGLPSTVALGPACFLLSVVGIQSQKPRAGTSSFASSSTSSGSGSKAADVSVPPATAPDSMSWATGFPIAFSMR